MIMKQSKEMWIPSPMDECHPVCENLVWLRSMYEARYGMIYTWEQMDQVIGLALNALYPSDAGRRPLWRVRCARHVGVGGGASAETFSLSEYEKIYKYLENQIEKFESSGFGLLKSRKKIVNGVSSNGNFIHVDVVVNVMIDGVKSQRVLNV